MNKTETRMNKTPHSLSECSKDKITISALHTQNTNTTYIAQHNTQQRREEETKHHSLTSISRITHSHKALAPAKNLICKAPSNAVQRRQTTTWYTAQNAAQKTKTQPQPALTAAQLCEQEHTNHADGNADEPNKNASDYHTAAQS